MASHILVGRRIVARRLVWVTLALLIPGASSGCANDQKVMAVANQMHTGLNPAVMQDPDLQSYLQSVGQRIVQTAKAMDAEGYGPKSHTAEKDNAWMFSDKMEFCLVNSKTLNAFTTGGEHMYIYNELFQHCKTEDELAAVMAHEYAHVYCRHVKNGMDRQTGQEVGAGVVAVGAGVASFFFGGGLSSITSNATTAHGLAAQAGRYVGMGYTRGDEDQADEVGFAFYTRAGWDPDHFADFFKHMIEAGYDTTPEMLSDHPKLSTRVANTDQRVAALPPDAGQWRKGDIADATKFAALQQRSAQLARSLPNDQTMQQAQTLLAAFPSCVAPTDQPGQKAARKQVVDAGWEARGVPR
jgi:predicted Zn-dependent protease